MDLEILIQQSGLLKSKPTFATLQKFLGAGYVGGVGPFFTFQKTPDPPDENGAASYMIYGKGSYIGRGFFLHTGYTDTCCRLSTMLPTTGHDLKTMAAVADVLASNLGGKLMAVENGQPAPWPGLGAWYAQAQELNMQHLRALSVATGDVAVSGVKFPVYLPESLRKRIGPITDNASEMYFTAYLADMQANNYAYLLPKFRRSIATGKPIVLYTLENNIPTIIPKQPFIPLADALPENEAVEEWWLVMKNTPGGVLGRIPYADFLAQLHEEDCAEYDEKHMLLRGFSPVRMKQLIQQPGAQAVFEDAPY